MGVFTGGLGAQFGYATETTYGTYKAVNRFAEFLAGETFQRQQNYLRPQGLAAGVQVVRGARTVATSRMAAGGVSFEVPDSMFSGILNLLHGETVAFTEEKPKAWKSVHKIGTTDPSKKSATLQFGKPNIEGVVEPYSYLGSIITSAEFSIGLDGYLTCAVTFDSRDETTAEALVAYAPTAGIAGFAWTNAKVLVNSVEQKFIKGFKLKLDKPADTARFYLGNTLKSQPLTNAYAAYSLELNVDYQAQTLYKFFEKGEATKVEITCTGRTVEAIPLEFKVLCEEARFNGDSPNVANQGALQQNIPLTVEYNGTNPPVAITVKSEDKEV